MEGPHFPNALDGVQSMTEETEDHDDRQSETVVNLGRNVREADLVARAARVCR